MATGMDRPEENLTLAEFRELFESVSSWGRWGADDQRGALNYLTPDPCGRLRGSSEAVRRYRSACRSTRRLGSTTRLRSTIT